MKSICIFTQTVLLAALTIAPVVKADPIQDSVVQTFKAAWMPSSSTPCLKVCEAADGAKAESEAFVIASIQNKLTSVCKGRAQTGGAYAGQGSLYGNNFNSSARNKVCMVSTADGSTIRLTKFHCLCVH